MRRTYKLINHTGEFLTEAISVNAARLAAHRAGFLCVETVWVMNTLGEFINIG